MFFARESSVDRVGRGSSSGLRVRKKRSVAETLVHLASAPSPRRHTPARVRPRDHRPASRTTTTAMSRKDDPNKLWPLADLVGKGFRDRRDSPMYAQFNTPLGWQSEWKETDNELNWYFLQNDNPVTLAPLPAEPRGPSAEAVRAACEALGPVVSVNRPSGFEIAIVQFENHDDAIKAQKLGVKFAIASDPNDSEYLRRYIEDGKDLAGNDAVGTATLRPRVRPRKLLNPELYKWRAAMREKHREASERREELLKVGITDDPNDPENRRRYFKKMFPHLVKANHVNGRYGDGDHPSLASKQAA